MRRALPNGRLEAFEALAARIHDLDCTSSDVQEGEPSTVGDGWTTRKADARSLPERNDTYTAVITSPPYPNRHDYTRVFGVELMFDFLNGEENRSLDARAFTRTQKRGRSGRQRKSTSLRPGSSGASTTWDGRIRRMLRGYFLDMYLCLREAARVCRGGAKMAFVVGNARYDGMALLVDEFTAELGERAGLACSEIRGVRWRGNSAQPRGKYGRAASRESVVMCINR